MRSYDFNYIRGLIRSMTAILSNNCMDTRDQATALRGLAENMLNRVKLIETDRKT